MKKKKGLTKREVLKIARRHLRRLFPERKSDVYVKNAFPGESCREGTLRGWCVFIYSRQVDPRLGDFAIGEMVLSPRNGKVLYRTKEKDLSIIITSFSRRKKRAS